jgi:hypothetical protein
MNEINKQLFNNFTLQGVFICLRLASVALPGVFSVGGYFI